MRRPAGTWQPSSCQPARRPGVRRSASPASSATALITSTRSTEAAKLPAEPGHAAQAANAAATANIIALLIPRRINASLAISRTPPARHASRRSPGGTSRASAQTASTQSRRSAGTSRAAARHAAAPALPSLLTGAARAAIRPPVRAARALGRGG